MKEMEIEAKVTILGDGQGVKIEIHDWDAGICFCTVEMTPEQFMGAVAGRVGYTSVARCSVRNLESVGRIYETAQISFPLPEGTKYHDKEAASRLLPEHVPDGWYGRDYFNSQDSFRYDQKTGVTTAHATIYRWVDRESE